MLSIHLPSFEMNEKYKFRVTYSNAKRIRMNLNSKQLHPKM